jgi:hypothetical protein
MSYYWDCNEEIEFKTIGGRMYLYVIHRDHTHNGICPHAHVLDMSSLSIEKAYVEKEMNRYCGMAHRNGKVIPYK